MYIARPYRKYMFVGKNGNSQKYKEVKELIIKCPVCETTYDNEVRVCTKCRFIELNKVFLSKEDYQKWVEDVVKPFREMYKNECKEKEKIKEIKSKLQKELQYKEEIYQREFIEKEELQLQYGQQRKTEKMFKENQRKLKQNVHEELEKLTKPIHEHVDMILPYKRKENEKELTEWEKRKVQSTYAEIYGRRKRAKRKTKKIK